MTIIQSIIDILITYTVTSFENLLVTLLYLITSIFATIISIGRFATIIHPYQRDKRLIVQKYILLLVAQ